MITVYTATARWWIYVLGGLLLLIAGILSLFWPEQVTILAVLVFGVVMLVIGVLAVCGSVVLARKRMPWLAVLFIGILCILIGIVSIIAPDILAKVTVIFLAGIAILAGILIIGYGTMSYAPALTRVLFLVTGIILVLIGVYMALNPGMAAMIIVMLWGVFACILGAMLIVHGFYARNMTSQYITMR